MAGISGEDAGDGATAPQLKEIKPTLDVDRCQTGGQNPKIK